jgi:hypothetical protein
LSASNVLHVDPGPLARLREIVEDPTTMSVLVQRVSEGETLKVIAKAWEVPYGRLAEWIIEDTERSAQYNQARQIWSDALATESVAIADDADADQASVQKAKLQIDTRLKLASKLNRATYGDAVEHKHTGSVSLIAVLSSLPRGREIDATPSPAALPAPTLGTSLPKKIEKTPEEFEI